MIKGSSRGIGHRMIPVRCRQYDFKRFKPQRSVPYRVYAYDKTFVAIFLRQRSVFLCLCPKHERKGYGNMNYYDMNTQEVLSQLDTSMNGLTGGEA